MKRYEAVSHYHATPKVPLVLRVDGRAFRTYCVNMEKPFDAHLRARMLDAATAVAAGLQGFVIAYHQSDEVSFVLLDTKKPTSEPHFGYDIQKLVSTTASAFTAEFFNREPHPAETQAEFDCRAFSLPDEEVPNYLLWRHRDWLRNSLSMFSRMFFSDKELLGKGHSERHEMLHAVGANWGLLDDAWKNGTVINGDATWVSDLGSGYRFWSDLWDQSKARYLQETREEVTDGQ